MNKSIKIILLASMFTANHAFAQSDTHIQKNFLLPRDQMAQLNLKVVNWHPFYNAKPDGRYSGTLQLTPFYQDSTSKTSVGKYFGFVHEVGGVQREQNYIGASNDADYLLKPGDVIHHYDAATPNIGEGDLVGRFKFEPNQEIFGARLDWHQDLDELINGLYFEISAPIVSVKNDMNLTEMGTQTSQDLPGAAGRPRSFRDYFIGEISNFDAANVQEELKYAKMGSSNSTGGFADVQANLGYHLFYKKNFRLSFNGSILVPTGNQPKAVNRFEPIYGSAGHWAIGGGLDTDLTFWESGKKCIKLLLIGDYKFYFKGTEKRTPTFKNAAGVSKLENIYLLGGEEEEHKVFPLANVLTQDLNIEPGSQFEFLSSLHFKFNSWHFDVGYNLFTRESETVEFKHAWNNYKYAVATYNYQTNADFNLTTNVRDGFSAITDESIDLNSVKQPAQTTHKAFAGLGYECRKRFKYPVMVALGGSYEWARNNASLENWAAWLKGSLAY